MAAKWTKSPPELVERFFAALPDDPRVERRKMFGFDASFVNGQMFAGLFEASMMLRLAETDRAKLGAPAFEPVPGRPMKEYVRLPDSLLAERTELRRWVKRGFDYAAALPPKVRKPAAKKPAAKKLAKKGSKR